MFENQVKLKEISNEIKSCVLKKNNWSYEFYIHYSYEESCGIQNIVYQRVSFYFVSNDHNI